MPGCDAVLAEMNTSSHTPSSVELTVLEITALHPDCIDEEACFGQFPWNFKNRKTKGADKTSK